MKQVDTLVCRLMRIDPGHTLEADLDYLDLSGTLADIYGMYDAPEDIADALDGAVVGVRVNSSLMNHRREEYCIGEMFAWYGANDDVNGPFYRGLREGLASGDNDGLMDKLLSRIMDYEKDRCRREEDVRQGYLGQAKRYAGEAVFTAATGSAFLASAISIGVTNLTAVCASAVAAAFYVGTVVLGVTGAHCWQDAKATERKMDEGF